MANNKYTGNLTVSDSDFHTIKFTGKTKGGSPICIIVKNAICMDDPSLSFAEKNEAVASATFTGCYENEENMDMPTSEPFEIICDDSVTSQAATIILGAGKITIDDVDVALTRGGSEFKRGASFRQINADGDYGPVKGRIYMDGATPTLKVNALTFTKHLQSIYPAMSKAAAN